ncbi:hypothetical protein GCM10022221_68860 [Actinocorallia aurea]
MAGVAVQVEDPGTGVRPLITAGDLVWEHQALTGPDDLPCDLDVLQGQAAAAGPGGGPHITQQLFDGCGDPGLVGILQHCELPRMQEKGQRGQRDHAGGGLVPWRMRTRPEPRPFWTPMPNSPPDREPLGVRALLISSLFRPT